MHTAASRHKYAGCTLLQHLNMHRPSTFRLISSCALGGALMDAGSPCSSFARHAHIHGMDTYTTLCMILGLPRACVRWAYYDCCCAVHACVRPEAGSRCGCVQDLGNGRSTKPCLEFQVKTLGNIRRVSSREASRRVHCTVLFVPLRGT